MSICCLNLPLIMGLSNLIDTHATIRPYNKVTASQRSTQREIIDAAVEDAVLALDDTLTNLMVRITLYSRFRSCLKLTFTTHSTSRTYLYLTSNFCQTTTPSFQLLEPRSSSARDPTTFPLCLLGMENHLHTLNLLKARQQSLLPHPQNYPLPVLQLYRMHPVLRLK